MKTILITGASSGIGRALAVRAARAGYAVYAVGRNVRTLAALGVQVSEEGGIITTDLTDVSEPANAPGLIGRMLAAYGHVDIVVNNAGAVAVGPIAAQSDEDLRVQFGTHVIGPLAIVREALPSLRATRGHVFMIGSGVARVPVGGLGAYPPSKAAVRSATAILRRELVPLEVAVTYVDPGAVDTAFMSRAGLPGAPQSVLVSPELVARKILLAIGTRPRVLNVAPLQTAAVTIAEIFPVITEAILERNPSLIGSGPQLALDVLGNGVPKIALPASTALEAPAEPPELPPAEEPDELDEPEVLDEVEQPAEPPELPPAEEPDEAEELDEPEVLDEVEQPAEPAARAFDDAGVVAEDERVAEVAPEAPSDEPEAESEAEPEPEHADATAFEHHEDDGVAELPLPLATVAPEPPADEPQTARWTFEPPDPAAVVETPAATDDDETARTTTSFDAAIEPLLGRMQRSKFDPGFLRSLLVPDAVLDVGETAMRWAGMPNKHERSLTSEAFFALAEWGFLAPRADGRYRVIRTPDDASA